MSDYNQLKNQNILQTITTSFSSVGTTTGTASGSITAGAPVVVNSNGTLSGVSNAAQVGPGTAVRFDTNYATLGDGTAAVYDSVNNKIITFYSYTSGNQAYPNATVGTVSGNAISWQSAVSFNNGQPILTSQIGAAYDPVNQKSVVFYVDRYYNYVMCQVVTTNATYPYTSFGSPVTVLSSPSIVLAADYDSVSGKIVVSVYNTGTSSAAVYIGTISGTSISFGTPVTYVTGGVPAPIQVGMIKCGNGKIVIAYGQTYARYVVVGTISGTSISFGTPASFYGDQGTLRSLDYSAADDKFIVSYNHIYSYVRAFSVSGTAITLGTQFQVDSNSSALYVKYSPSLKKFTIFKGLTARTVTLTETTITTSSTITLLAEIGTNPVPTIVYNSANSVYVMVGKDNTIGTGESGYAYVFHPAFTSLSATNYIGISTESYSNSQTVTVQVLGSINSLQTGLTPGQSYYVQNSGTLSTTPGTPAIFAGTAISSTSLLVKG